MSQMKYCISFTKEFYKKLKIVTVINGTFPHYPQVSPQAMPGKTPGKRGDFESCGIYPHPPGEK